MSGRNQEAIAFLQNLDIKSATFRGFDKVEVFETLKTLSNIYESALERDRKTHFDEINALKAQFQAQLQKESESKNQILAEKKQVEKQLADTKTEVYDTLAHMQQQKQQIGDECQRVLEEAEREKHRIINEAKETASHIRKQATVEVIRHRASIVNELTMLRQEKENVFSELSLLRGQISQLLDRSIAELPVPVAVVQGIKDE